MERVIYGNLNDAGLELLERDGKFFVRYDAGAHAIAWREDELTLAEAERLQQGLKQEREVIISLQARLEAQGINPYKQNWTPCHANT